MRVGFGADQVRRAEQPLVEVGAPLMERAAFALASEVLNLVRSLRGSVHGASAVVIVGSGNNGGDGLHAAAYLSGRGMAVTVLSATDHPHSAGLHVAHASRIRVLRISDIGVERALQLILGADVVLDALVGIGSDGSGVRGEAGPLVAALAALAPGDRPAVVAVDVPSGIGIDDGAVRGTVLPADLTVTFGAVKTGLLLPPADRFVGRIKLVDIGLDMDGASQARRLEAADIRDLWPIPGSDSQKYTRGVLGLVAGSNRYPGAAVLAAAGAVGAGAGLVRFLDQEPSPGPVGAAVLAARPEVVVGSGANFGRVQAWAAGPGIDPNDRQREEDVYAAVRGGVPTVLDAGAIGFTSQPCGPQVVLTPHAGELADLLRAHGEQITRAQVELAPLVSARRAHDLTGATVLLKGATTLIVGVDGVWSQADAPAWLATAGAGDVLTGLLGALLAARADDVVADPALAGRLAAAAVLVHGRAAARANPGGPVSALSVAEAIPATLAALLAEPFDARQDMRRVRSVHARPRLCGSSGRLDL